MHAHNYPIDQVKEVALTTIEALNRVESTASDADFNDGNFARLDAVSKLSGLFAENPKILWHWLPMMGVEITTDQIDLDETDTNNVARVAASTITKAVYSVPEDATVLLSVFGGGFATYKMSIGTFFEHAGVSAMQTSVPEFLAVCKSLRMVAVFQDEDTVELCFIVANTTKPTLYDFLIEVVRGILKEGNSEEADKVCIGTLDANMRVATVLSSNEPDDVRRSRMALHYAAGQYKRTVYMVLRNMSLLTEMPRQVAQAAISTLNSVNLEMMPNFVGANMHKKKVSPITLLATFPIHSIPMLALVPEAERCASDFACLLMGGLFSMVQADIHHCTQMRKEDKEIQEKAGEVLTKAARMPF